MKATAASRPLSRHELEVWHALKRLSESALTRVGSDIEAATGLSGADFGILSRLEDLGQGVLLQNELATSLGWEKARLSHQLTRMESRTLVRRGKPASGRGILVAILPLGCEKIAAARPVHAAAVRRHILEHLDAREAQILVDAVRRMKGD